MSFLDLLSIQFSILFFPIHQPKVEKDKPQHIEEPYAGKSLNL
jgi:hypothetical protein